MKDLSSFINNNNGLEATSDKAPTYLAKLFSKSQWLLRLQKAPLASTKGEPLPKKHHEVPVKSPEAPQKVVAKAAETPKQVAPEPPAQVSKLSEYASKEPVAKEGQQVSVSFEVAEDYNAYLKSFCPTWSVDSIVGIDSFNERIDVLFLGLDEFSENDLPESTPLSLIESDQDLLGKMIKAMNLEQGRFLRLPLLSGDKELEFTVAAIQYFKPKVVVPLGAHSTNIMLEKRVKLSNVHGQFEKKAYRVNGEDMIVEVSPLFHPQLLEINQSMKRTAWIDMQKVMKFVGNN